MPIKYLLLLVYLWVSGVQATYQCKAPDVCCDSSLSSCQINSGCTAFGDSCTPISGLGFTSCSGALSTRTLDVSNFTVKTYTGTQYLNLNYDGLFTNTVGPECQPFSCAMFTAANLNSNCGNALTSAVSFPVHFPYGEVKIDTTNPFNSHACIECNSYGTNRIKANNFQVVIETSNCDNTNPILPRPFLAALTYQFSIEQDTIPETVSFIPFEDQGTDQCAFSGLSVVISSSVSTTHPDLEVNSEGLVVLKDATKKHQAATIDFALQIQFQGAYYMFVEDSAGNQDLKLIIECGTSSTTVAIQADITVGGLTYGVEQYLPTGPTAKYYLPTATSSLEVADSTTSCIIQSRTTTLGELATPVFTAVSLESGSAYFVEPVSPTVAARHVFDFTVTAVGGASATTSSLVLHLGCYSSATFTDNNIITPQNHDVQASPISLPLQQFQPFVPALVNCNLLSTEIVDVEDDGTPVSSSSVSISCPSSSPCDVSTTMTDRPLTLTYKVKQTFSDDNVQTSGVFTATFTCTPAAQNILLDYPSSLPVSYTQYDTSNIIYFGPYDCVIPNCCDPMTHEVLDAGGNSLSISTATNGSFTFSADTQSVGTSVYTFKASDGNGHSAQWDAQITIKDICTVQSTFQASSVTPSGEELMRIMKLGGWVTVVASEVQISLVVDVKEDQSFELSLAERITSPYCQASDYRLTSVTSTGTFSEAVGNESFSISSAGLLSFEYTSALPINETYSLTVDVFNGLIWSSLSLSVLQIELCEDCGGQNSLPEMAPYFVEEPEQHVLINATSFTESFTMALPDVFDPNGDTWEMKVSGDESVSVAGSSLVVDLGQKNTTSNFTVQIIIIDATNLKASYTCSFELRVVDPDKSIIIELPSAPWQPEEEEKWEIPRPAASIKSLTNLGELTIEFNETLSPIPDLNPENLGISFDHPLEISPLAEQDRLVVHIKSSLRPLLRLAATSAPLAKESWTLMTPIPKQMPETRFSKAFEEAAASVKVSLKILLIIALLLHVLSSGGMIYMLQMIRSFQIVLHFPLLRIIVPANVSMFFAYLIPIVMFDVLDPEWTTELVLNFDEEGQEEISGDILDQMKDLGYETHNSILNLGSLSIFLVAYFLKLGLYLFSVGFHRWTGRGQNLKAYIRNGLFFGDLVSIVLDAYFEFIISGYLQLQLPLWSFNGEVSAMLVGSLAFFLALVWLPLVLAWQVTKSKQEALHPTYQDKWGTLLEGVSTKSRWSRAYFLVFVLRRLSFFAVAMFVNQYFEFQIIWVLALNMTNFLYIGLIMPQSFPLLNCIELINEFLIQLCTIALFIFTEWVPDPSMQYHVGGWMTIALISILLLGNLYFILRAFGYRSRLLYLKLSVRCKAWKSRETQTAENPEARLSNSDDSGYDYSPPLSGDRSGSGSDPDASAASFDQRSQPKPKPSTKLPRTP